jgi:PAS domain S-box-containing protein
MPRVPTAGIPIDTAPPALASRLARGWPLRRYLLAMTLAVLLPVLTFAGLLLWYDVTRQFDVHRRGMLDTAQAFSLAVDREWARVQAILQTLAASELLDTGDLRAFYDLCTKVVEQLSGARIILFAPSGQQLLNTLRPFAAELPNPFIQGESSPPARAGEVPMASAETVRRAFQTGQPVYSDLFIALVSLRPSVALDVPVWRHGRVVYVLTMAMSPESFTRLLQEQNLPVDTLATIVDQRGMIIARSQKPEQFVGQPAHPTLLADLATSDTGWERNRSVEQVPVYSAWTRSALTGWTTVISMTEASIAGPIRRSVAFWGSTAALALSLGFGLAWLVARQITTPLVVLTRSADLVQRGQPFTMPSVAVQEVRHLYAALLATAEAMRQQAVERERRRIAEAEAALRHRAAEALAETNAALRQAEAAERAQREQWQTTLASIGDAVIVTDSAGRVRFLNPVAHTLTGWAPDEATGQPLPQVFRIVNEETRQPVDNPVTRVMREGVIVGLANHTVLVAKDGRETSIDDSGAPIHDAQGQISGAVLVFRDITARRQAEAERTQREAAQRFLAEASALLSSSLETPAQLEHLAQLLVPTLADWCSIDLLQDDGRIHRVAVVHADPTRAALAEQLRQQYPLLAADAGHTLVRVLRSGQSWFDPAVSPDRLRAEARDAAHWELEQSLGFTAEMVVPLLARGRVLGTITCVLGEGTRRYSAADLTLAEELARRAALALDNARLYQQAQATQSALEQANATLEQRVQERTAALERAMTEQRRLEQEARRAEHFALLGRLAAGVSHEIRNPLGAIFLHVDLLAEELVQPSADRPEAVAEALATIRTNLARLDDLVQDYLSLVRVHTIQRDVQDLGVAMVAWSREFEEIVAAHGVALKVDGVATLGAVAFHPSTLRRALLNLVQNAAEAMPQGGTVTLAAQGTADQVQLEVRDTGNGIPAEHLARIFEPLHTTKPGGTGLGLYIVQEVVAAHGGQVRVQSVEGQGTTFTLTLPREAR